MKPSEKRRRFWIWIGIALIVEVVAITLCKRMSLLFPSGQTSEIYTRYADMEGINAAFFKDFKINDSVFVDVTILEATDTNGWKILCDDFSVSPWDSIAPNVSAAIKNGRDLIFSKPFPVTSLQQSAHSVSTDTVLRSVSYVRKIVSIFHVKNESETRAVLFYNLKKSIKE